MLRGKTVGQQSVRGEETVIFRGVESNYFWLSKFFQRRQNIYSSYILDDSELSFLRGETVGQYFFGFSV